jgi:hypothetical protein
MIIKTRKLPATTTEGERMRATSDSGHVLTIPFGVQAHTTPQRDVAMMLAKACGYAWVEQLDANKFRARD